MDNKKTDKISNDPLDLGYRMLKNLAFLNLGFIATGATALDLNNPVEKAEFVEKVLPLMSLMFTGSVIGMVGCKVAEGVKTVYKRKKI